MPKILIFILIYLISTTSVFASGSGQVYPQFKSSYGVIRWLKEQMPLKVFVSDGISLDTIMDDELGAPFDNVDNINKWPDLAAFVVDNANRYKELKPAEGFTPEQYQAVIDGINQWKRFEKDGFISFQFTKDIQDADIYVFFVNHFVNKLGMGFFSNDIRGYTAKRSFSYKLISQGKKADFKPVLIQLRTTDSNGIPLTYQKMKAASAHEFGHALGIEGHSTNPNDLMSVNYGTGNISQNDAQTLRYLYSITPDLIP